MQSKTHLQVPGDSERDSDDGEEVSRGVRGEENLRVAVSNHQTTCDFLLDNDTNTTTKKKTEMMTNCKTKYFLRSTKSIQNAARTLKQHQTIPLSPSSTSSLFESLASSPHSFELLDKSSSSSSSSNSSNPEDVVQLVPTSNTAPTAGHKSVRKKWTVEMNEFIWRTYLIVSELESKPHYLDLLHAKFIDKFKGFNVSKQRIGDQRRAIIRNNFLPQQTLDNIRKDVEKELENKNQSNSDRFPSRLRWTNDINEAIIREYFKITQCESNRTAYREPLHAAITSKFPHISHVSQQRIADQRRVIVNNKRLTAERIQEIRSEVQQTLITTPAETYTNNNEDGNHSPTPNDLPSCDNNYGPTSNVTECNRNISNNTVTQECTQATNECIRNIQLTFVTTYEKYKNSDPTQRPFIPKQNTSKKLAHIVSYLDKNILPQYISTDLDFITIQTLIYCAAFTAATCNGTKIRETQNDNYPTHRNKLNTPPWQKRLIRKKELLRKDIGRMTQYIRGNRSNRIMLQIAAIKDKYKVHSQYEENNISNEQYLDSIKQKLSATSSRLRRYESCTLKKKQNAQFANNERFFYRQLNKQTNNTLQTLDTTLRKPFLTELKGYWSSIWAKPVQHNEQAEWILLQSKNTCNVPQMAFENIPVDTFLNVLKNTHNWKTPGTDHIHNYWYKKFTSIHPSLHKHLNLFIQNPNSMPLYITQGTTFMIPKDNTDTHNPAKYRPITCLQTIYKILTACITQLIDTHITKNKILAQEQKGCRKRSQGCKEQLIIDSVIMKKAYTQKQNICTMYVDYRKAFDSVPHSWLIQILNIYNIHPNLINFLAYTMQSWRTKLKVGIGIDTLETDEIPIRRGIFQGDALSPIWFCLALNPLSHLLNKCNFGLGVQNNHLLSDTTITHLLYMDDIKLYSNNITSLHKLADITHQFSEDIHMEFGIDKCKTFSFIEGKLQLNDYILSTGEKMDALEHTDSYKYLGFQQNRQICQKETKLDLTRNFTHRINSLLKTKLNSRNLIKAINSYAIPILTYSFGVIKWSQTDLKKLQRIINTSMTKQRKHHPRSCIERLTLPRDEGGRGIIDITNLHNRQINTLRRFFHERAVNSEIHKAIVNADKKFSPLNLLDRKAQPNENITDNKDKIEAWNLKSLHGRHRSDLQQKHVDMEASNAWLRRGDLFPETEGFMLAIQDQVVETKNYQKHIIRRPNINDTCRHCHSSPETIQHITSACKSIAQTDYKHRHDQVAAIIHQNLAFQYKLISEKVPYYKYKPQSVLENNSYRIYWDRTIVTDKTIYNNRPDITVLDKQNSSVYLIDIAICNTHNLTKTFTEKISKYTDLSIEIKTQWKVKNTKMVPIVLSSTGVIPHSLHCSLKTLNVHKSTYTLLQKATILNTCRLVRKFLT